jgi:hypothetical protein
MKKLLFQESRSIYFKEKPRYPISEAEASVEKHYLFAPEAKKRHRVDEVKEVTREDAGAMARMLMGTVEKMAKRDKRMRSHGISCTDGMGREYWIETYGCSDTGCRYDTSFEIIISREDSSSKISLKAAWDANDIERKGPFTLKMLFNGKPGFIYLAEMKDYGEDNFEFRGGGLMREVLLRFSGMVDSAIEEEKDKEKGEQK